MKYIKLIALLLLVQTNIVLAQSIELKEKQLDKENRISFCKPVKNLTVSTANQNALLQSILKADIQLQFELDRTVNNEDNVHNYYHFTLQGIPITGADYAVHSTNGIISFANGNIPVVTKKVNAVPKISFEQAQSILNELLSNRNKNYQSISFTYKIKGVFWFYQNKTLTLTYKIETKSNNSLVSGNYYVDAETGLLIGFEAFICTGHIAKQPPPNVLGTAQTLYSGTQNFTTDSYSGAYRLREIRNGVNIATLNANNESNEEVIVNSAADFFDDDNNWQAGEHGIDRYATDVHWATENVVEYWRTQQNRNSINNNGMSAIGYVHTAIPSSQNINAFWSRDKNAMFYGDGNFGIGPIAAFDVVAHEFGHGICQYTSNLTYNTSESGALNEGFSDIWGAAIEGWAAPGKQKWKIGEDIFSGCLRNLENPKAPVAYEGQHPNTYLQQYWSTSGEPHTNSTILSHWFYLVSEGGNGTNDLSNTYSVTGVGISTAAKIAYKTEQLLNSNANYAMARTMSIMAAQELYGVNSCEEKAVTDAWYAVGVGAAFTGNIAYVPVITGNGGICGVNATQNYTVNLPVGATATWSGNASVSITPITSNGSEVAVTNISTYGATTLLTATINSAQTGGCNPVPGTYTGYKQIVLGGPGPYSFIPYITQGNDTRYMSNYCNKLTYVCYPNNLQKSNDSTGDNVFSQTSWCASGYITDLTATSIGWSIYQKSPGNFHGGALFNGNQFSVNINANYPDEWIVLRCTRTNSCGSAYEDYRFYANGFCNVPPGYCVTHPNDPGCAVEARITETKTASSIILSPNPTSGQFTITLKNNKDKFYIKEVRIKNKMGLPVYNKLFSDNKTTQNISMFGKPTDIYLVEVFDGQKWQTAKIIIQQ